MVLIIHDYYLPNCSPAASISTKTKITTFQGSRPGDICHIIYEKQTTDTTKLTHVRQFICHNDLVTLTLEK